MIKQKTVKKRRRVEAHKKLKVIIFFSKAHFTPFLKKLKKQRKDFLFLRRAAL